MSIKNTVLKFALVIVIVLSAGEAITRAFITSPHIAVPHPDLGWIYQPHGVIFHTTEGWAVNTVNDLGFNDDDFVSDPEHPFIAVLGDSYTEALQMPRASNFTSLLEKMYPCTHVYDFGRSGLSPVQYPILSKNIVGKLPEKPRLQVLALTAGDLGDILRNKAELVRDPQTGKIVNIVLHEKKLHWLRQKANFIFAHSALASLLKDRLRAAGEGGSKGKADTHILDDKQTYAKVADIMEYVLTKVAEQSDLEVVYIPSVVYLVKGEVQYKANSKEFGELIEAVAKRLNIPFVSAFDELEAAYKTEHRSPAGFMNAKMGKGHLNELGHLAVAKGLSKIVPIHCN